MDSEHISLPILDAAMPPAIDPVCGMKVNVSSAKHKFDYNGKTYYFCGRSCLETFSANPGGFLTASTPGPKNDRDKQASSAEASPDAFYTCPMHPEIRQRGPGSCPKCGMALEPESPLVSAHGVEYTCPMHPEIVRSEPGTCPKCGMALEPRTVVAEEANPELVAMSRRFWTSAALTVPLFILAEGRPSRALHPRFARRKTCRTFRRCVFNQCPGSRATTNSDHNGHWCGQTKSTGTCND